MAGALLLGVYASMFIGMAALVLGLGRRRWLSSLGITLLGLSLTLLFLFFYTTGSVDPFSLSMLALGLGAIATGLYDLFRRIWPR